MLIAALTLILLPACAGHKELKAPCRAASLWFSGSAYAGEPASGAAGETDGPCGPMLQLNMPLNVEVQS